MSCSEVAMNVSSPWFYMTPCQIKNEVRIEPTEPNNIILDKSWTPKLCDWLWYASRPFRKDRNKINEDSTSQRR